MTLSTWCVIDRDNRIVYIELLHPEGARAECEFKARFRRNSRVARIEINVLEIPALIAG